MDSIWNISTQQMQIFLKAAELNNFTKVANYFNYTPSMVSKNITALEDELGIKLFERNYHELALTQAGQVLAGEWRHFMGSLNTSIAKARRCQEEERSRVVFGFVDSSNTIDEMMSQCIKQYPEINPGTKIVPEKHDMHRAVELLNLGMLDLIQTSDMELPYIMELGLKWEKVIDTKVAVYVPEENPLFDRASISMTDIKNHELLILDPEMHPSYMRWLNELCGKYGFTPQIAGTCRTVRSILFNLKIGKEVFIGNSITSDWCDDHLKEFFLDDKAFSLLAWRADSGSTITDFKDFLLEYAEKRLQNTM